MLPFEIHHGSTRSVILFWKYAIKFPTFSSYEGFIKGILSNIKESKISSRCPYFFVPILWSSPLGFIVIMPRCRKAPRNSWMVHSFMSDLFHHSRDEQAEAQIARKFCEYVDDNIVMYKGKPMCIDYGTYMPLDATYADIRREQSMLVWRIERNVKKLEKENSFEQV